MKIDQFFTIAWRGNTKEHYIKKGYIFTKINDLFQVKFEDMPVNSKLKAQVKCDNCNIIYEKSIEQINRAENHLCSKNCRFEFKKTKYNCHICNKDVWKNKTQQQKSISGFYFCSNNCVGKYNQQQFKLKELSKNCVICNKIFKVIESTSKTHITCSRSCQGKWQSLNRTGENSSNYKNAKETKNCLFCDKIYSNFKRKNSKFCSKDCKVSYWKENTLTSDSFKQNRYKGIVKSRKIKKETNPERLVRFWLENNNYVFETEKPLVDKYIVDFYLSDFNLVIEVFGDYWHVNPEVYGENLISLNNYQIKQVKKDAEKIESIKKQGFNLIILWEKEINEDLQKNITKKLKTIISP